MIFKFVPPASNVAEVDPKSSEGASDAAEVDPKSSEGVAEVDPKSLEGASDASEVDPKLSEGDPAASDVAASSQSIPEPSGKRCRS